VEENIDYETPDWHDSTTKMCRSISLPTNAVSIADSNVFCTIRTSASAGA